MIIFRNILVAIVLTPIFTVAFVAVCSIIAEAPGFLLFLFWFFCAIALIVVQLHVDEMKR